MKIFAGVLLLLFSIIAFIYAFFTQTDFGGGSYLPPLIVGVILLVISVYLLITGTNTKNTFQTTPQSATADSSTNVRINWLKVGIVLIGLGAGCLLVVKLSDITSGILPLLNIVITPLLLILGIIFVIIGLLRKH